jgi:hypothetical protein
MRWMSAIGRDRSQPWFSKAATAKNWLGGDQSLSGPTANSHSADSVEKLEIARAANFRQKRI